MENRNPAWIEVIPTDEATGDVAEAYAEYTAPWGGIDHILKIHSLNIPSMHAHVQLYRTLMYGKSPIRRPEREMIATVVSALNHCRY